MQEVQLHGATMRYRCEGSGPPMVLVHNAGSDHRNWDATVEHFRDRYTVHAVDMFGYGASDAAGPQSLELHANAVGDFVDALDLSAPVLVGHCVGAAAVWQYSLRNPARVSQLVLFSPATEATMKAGMWGPLYRVSRRSPVANRLAELAARAARRSEAARRLSVLAMFGDEPPPPDYLAHAMQGMERSDVLPTLNQLLKGFGGFGVLDRAVRPEGFPPTLLLWGTRNRVLPISTMRPLLDWLRPDAQHVFEGRGHLCMVEAPAEVNAVIDEFLA